MVDVLVLGGELRDAIEHEHLTPGGVVENDKVLVLGLDLVQHL